MIKKINATIKDSKSLVLIVLAFTALFNTLQSDLSPISSAVNFTDSSVYQYIGKLILEGKMPYKDAFDHKGPILYLLNSIGVLINEKTGIWAIDVLFMLLALVFAYKTTRIIVGGCRWLSMVITLGVMSGITQSYWIGNTPDYYALCFEVVATYIISKCFMNGNVEFHQSTAIGILVALCFLLKFTTVGVIGILCLGLLILLILSKRYKAVRNSILGFLLGMGIVFIPVMIWLVVNNAWNYFIDDYILFNLFYGKTNREYTSRWNALYHFTTDRTYLLVVCSSLIFFATRCGKKIFMKGPEKVRDIFAITGLSALIVQTAIAAMPGRYYNHYSFPFYIAYLVVFALTAREIETLDVEPRKRNVLVYALSLVMLLPNTVRTLDYQQKYTKPRECGKVLDLIAPYKGEKIAIASPHDCGWYIWNNSESATTYPYAQTELGDDNVIWQDYELQIEQAKPRVIVWYDDWNIENCLPDACKNYSLVDTIDNRSVYVRMN